MNLKYFSSACFVALFALAMNAQAPPATPAAPGMAPATPAGTSAPPRPIDARPPRPAPTGPPANTVTAGIPVNYDESKVGAYTLPDPLKLNNGTTVTSAKEWRSERRPQIVKIFQEQQYGVAPGRPADESFEITDKGTPALDGKAIRKQVTIHLSKKPGAPEIHLLEYLPANAKGPVPMFFQISFGPNQNTVDDPGIIPDKVRDAKTNELVTPPATPGRFVFGRVPVTQFLDAGIGVATYYYAELDPDTLTGFPFGVRALYKKPGQTGEDDRAPDAWGSIAAWAWGMSRVEDYFETDPGVDAKRVTIQGVSRLGKTVTWAGAYDQRFAAVIASCGGEGGAALSHRDSGETIAHLTAPSRFPYQFAANYAKWGGFPDKAPMDANMLLALIAPRPVLLQTGSTDYWSDPKGEFLAAIAAGPTYRLLGKHGLGVNVWPPAKIPLFSDGLNYYMHEGPHGMVPTDWDIYIQFLRLQFHLD